MYYSDSTRAFTADQSKNVKVLKFKETVAFY